MATWKGGNPIKQANSMDCWCLLGVPECIALVRRLLKKREEPALSGFLRKPKLERKVHDMDDADRPFCAFGTCALQGWRSQMEDDHFASVGFDGDPSSALFAVFDGHGGRAVANFCAATCAQFFKRTEAYRAGNYEDALSEAFLQMDDAMRKGWPKCFLTLSGSRASKAVDLDPDPCSIYGPGTTGLAAFIKGNRLYVANAGDCRAVLCRAGKAIKLTTDHDPYLPEELIRIERAGGWVNQGRVKGCLAMSRALGDFQFKNNQILDRDEQMVICRPELTVQELCSEDEFLVMGCDGIWEVWETDKVIDFCRRELDRRRRMAGGSCKLSSVLSSLCDQLIARDIDSSNGLGLDNMSSILIDLRQ